MKSTYIKQYFSIFSIVVFVVFFLVGSVKAQNAIPLTVGPARQQISMNPGEEAQIVVKFYNQSEIPLSGFMKVNDFVVEDDKGTPRIVEDTTQASPKYSASTWITLPFDRMTIAANDRTVVQTTIRIPSDARPGGRYVALYFEPTSAIAQPVAEAGTSITPRIASLLYIRVQGPISENAYISRMFAQSFSEYGPIAVTAQITNKGDYHIRPRGVFTLTNFLGTVEQVNLKEANIFPDALRTFTTSIGSKWMIGKYTINLATTYGEKLLHTEKSVTVWVFPWRAALVIILSLIILYLIGRSVYKSFIVRESTLEEELARERQEIEKLKDELHKRDR
jgi:hypothetical protein